MPVKPISPAEIAATKVKHIPDQVIELWNTLIARNFHGSTSRVLQKEAIVEMTTTLINGMYVDRASIFKLGWLEIEDIYSEAGWKVEYDKPGFNESYDAVFIFRK